MPVEELDLGFVDFEADSGVASVAIRRRTRMRTPCMKTPRPNRGRFGKLEHETRFELATLTLAREFGPEEIQRNSLFISFTGIPSCVPRYQALCERPK